MKRIVSKREREETIPFSNRELAADLWVRVAPYKKKYIAAIIGRFIGTVAWLYPIFAIGQIVDFLVVYTPGTSFAPLWTILVLWIIAAFLRNVPGRFLAMYWGRQVAEQAALDSQLSAIKHLFALDISWHERENAGNKLKRIHKGSEGVKETLKIVTEQVVEITVTFVGAVIVLATVDVYLSLFFALFIVMYTFVAQRMMKKIVKAVDAVNIEEEELHGLSFESIGNIRTVKVLSLGGRLYEILKESTATLYGHIQERIYRYQIRGLTIISIGRVFRIGILAFVIYGIIHGRYEVGFLVIVDRYFSRVWDLTFQFSEVSQILLVSRFGIARMKQIENEPVAIDSEDGKQNFPVEWKKIRVEDLSFSYGDREVLSNVSFELKRGESIGVVGLSGAGKSTLMKLLLKEYEDYTGHIYIDDVPLHTISKQSYFSHTAVVLQDTEVFNFTLAENVEIAAGKQIGGRKRLNQALEIAHVSDFLDRLPKGLDTIIGERGVKLSGGERQRLGIARAVYKEPALLLLDEATSHLDVESEQKIQDSLHQFLQNMTAIVIAHRLSTLKEMDRILVIEDGKIVEQGSFSALQKKKGRFYDLWQKQKL